VLNPFYIFQIAAIIFWFWQGYTTFAVILLILSVIGIAQTVSSSVSSQNRIIKMAKFSCDVELRLVDKTFITINSAELLPGDFIKVPDGKVIPCDLILCSGIAILNEALLTGESIPVIKQKLPDSDEIYDEDKHSKNTIFSGTRVI
jgi:cation-transporting ATPase 13A3/4/5